MVFFDFLRTEHVPPVCFLVVDLFGTVIEAMNWKWEGALRVTRQKVTRKITSKLALPLVKVIISWHLRSKQIKLPKQPCNDWSEPIFFPWEKMLFPRDEQFLFMAIQCEFTDPQLGLNINPNRNYARKNRRPFFKTGSAIKSGTSLKWERRNGHKFESGYAR